MKLCEIRDFGRDGVKHIEMLFCTQTGWRLLTVTAPPGNAYPVRTLSRNEAIAWCNDNRPQLLFGFTLH